MMKAKEMKVDGMWALGTVIWECSFFFLVGKHTLVAPTPLPAPGLQTRLKSLEGALNPMKEGGGGWGAVRPLLQSIHNLGPPAHP